MNRPAIATTQSGLMQRATKALLIALLVGLLQIIQGPGLLLKASALSTVGTGACASQVDVAANVKVYTSSTRCILEFDTTTAWTPPVGVATVYFLAVGGGGGGASGRGGGGGAGGLETGTTSVIGSTMNMTVGTGGAGGGGSSSNGADSYFGLITHAYGGGGGGNSFGTTNNVQSGGSGGGAGIYQNASTSGWAGGTSTGGQGNSGGGSGYPYASLGSSTSNYDTVRNSAGGGGAGGAGISAQGGYGGQNWNLSMTGLPSARTPDGGAGLSINITGTATCYAAGGGGSFGYFYLNTEWNNYYSAGKGAGGSCGGTAIGGVGGDYSSNVIGGNGAANTGSGGGAGNVNNSTPYAAAAGGSGGSGVIVVTWLKNTITNPVTSPTSTTVNRGDTFTMTASGTPDYAGVTRTWQWQRSSDNGATWSSVGTASTANPNTYTDTATSTLNGYQYRAMYSDSDSVTMDTGTTSVATLTVIPAPATSDTDSVLNLSGTQYAYSSPVTTMGDTFTIELWVNPSAACSNSADTPILQRLKTLVLSCHDNKYFLVLKDNSGTTNATVDFNTPLIVGSWQHISVTRASSTNSYILYYNGVQSNSFSASSPNSGTNAWQMGGTLASQYFAGQIDEVKVWNTVRTATNIKSDMRTFTPLNSSGLINYWDFNETSTAKAYDISSSATGYSDLFFVGSPTLVENRSVDTTTVTGVTIQKFTRSYLTITGGWKPPVITGSIRALEVAGGGAGGADRGGGGGGGGRIYSILNSLPTVETITVGMGGFSGTSGAGGSGGTNGESSTLGTVIAHGGGAGGTSPGAVVPAGAGQAGGSGGGGSFSALNGSGTEQDSGTGNVGGYNPPEGYRGAPSLKGSARNAGGGGGATGVGISGSGGDSTVTGSAGTRPDGGPGDTLSITGVAVQYSPGGGGARGLGGLTYPNYESSFASAPSGLGGASGCGNGANVFQQFGGDGCANTGGGGGGGATGWTNGSFITANSGRGGSGVVVLRYITASGNLAGVSDTVVAESSSATFYFDTTSISTLTRGVQWQYETSSGTTWLNVTDGTGANTSTYITPTLLDRQRNGYRYRVAVTDTDIVTGETLTQYSPSGTLYINAAPDAVTDYSVNFTQSNSYLKSAQKLTLPSGDFTMEVWTNPSTSCSGSTIYTVADLANGMGIYCQYGSWFGRWYNGTTNINIAFGESVTASTWHHLALIKSGTNMRTYYDGQRTDTTTGITFAPQANNYLYVGSNGTTNYLGQVDELKIYTAARDDSVYTDLDTAAVTTDSTLFAYYNFNEGSGVTIHDKDASSTGPIYGTDLVKVVTYFPTWQTVESSSVQGLYQLYQFNRTIITSRGGWTLPTSSVAPTALIVGGGGGGGVNAGIGGGGGAQIEGKVNFSAGTSLINIKVGVGGINGYSVDPTNNNTIVIKGGNGGNSYISSADSTVNIITGGGTGGRGHWDNDVCLNPSSNAAQIAGYTQTLAAGGIMLNYTGITSGYAASSGGYGGGIQPLAQQTPYPGLQGQSSSISGTAHNYGAGGGAGGWNVAGASGGGDNGHAAGGSGNQGSGVAGNTGEDGLSNMGYGGGGGGDGCATYGGRGAAGVVYLQFPLIGISFVSPSDTKTSVGSYGNFIVGGTPAAGYTRTYQWQKQDSGTVTWSDVSESQSSLYFNVTSANLTYGSPTYTIPDTSTSGVKVRARVTDTNGSGASVSAYTDSATLKIYARFTLTGGGGSIRTPFGTPASTPAFTSSGGVTPITWSLISAPSGISIDSRTAILTASNTTEASTNLVTISASDATGLSLTETTSVYVGSAPKLMVGDVYSWIDSGSINQFISRKVSIMSNVFLDSSGNTYAVGTSDPGFKIGNTTPTTQYSAYIIKTNKSGTVLWTQTLSTIYGGLTIDQVTADGAGNVIVAGRTRPALLASDSSTLFPSFTHQAYFLYKLNAVNGASIWGSIFEFTNNAQGTVPLSGLATDSQGGIVLGFTNQDQLGYTSPSGTATTIRGPLNYGEAATFLKISSIGEILWMISDANSDQNNFSFISGIGIDLLGNIYVSGNVYGSMNLGNQTGTSLYISNSGNIISRMFVAKFSTDGIGQWLSQDSGGNINEASTIFSSGDQIAGLALTPAGDLYAYGFVKEGTTLMGKTYSFPGMTAGILFKFNSSGVEQWARAAYDAFGTGNANWKDAGVDGNGNVFLQSGSNQNLYVDGTTYSYPGLYDALYEYSSTGTGYYLGTLGGNKGGVVAISVDALGNIAAVGNYSDTITVSGFTFVPHSYQDVFVGMLKNNSSGASASLVTKYGTVSNSPRIIVFGGTPAFAFSIRSTYGGKVLVDTTSGNSLIYSNASSLIPGNYLESVTVLDALGLTDSMNETLTVAKADTVTIHVNQTPSYTYNGGAAVGPNDTITVTGLVNNDTVTTVIYYIGTANTGETYSATNTTMPTKAGSYSVTPVVTAVSYGTKTGTQLDYYTYTQYDTASLTINRATRSLRIGSPTSSYSYSAFGIWDTYTVDVGDTATLISTGVGADTATITWSLVSGSCSLTASGAIYSSGANICVVNISVPQTANYLAASDTKTIVFLLLVTHLQLNDGSQNIGGLHTIIITEGQRLDTTTPYTAPDSSTTTYAPTLISVTQVYTPDQTTAKFNILGTGFWTTGVMTLTIGRDVVNRDATSGISALTSTSFTLTLSAAYLVANGFSVGNPMGRLAVITPSGQATSSLLTLSSPAQPMM